MKRKGLYFVPIGSILEIDGNRWKVSGRDAHGYHVRCKESRECTTLSFEDVDAEIQQGRCEVTTPKTEKLNHLLWKFTGGFVSVHQLPKEDRRYVASREALVKAMLEMEAGGRKLTERYLDRDGVSDELAEAAGRISGDRSMFGARGGKRQSWNVPKGRTLKNYYATYHKFGRNPVALMDRSHKKGAHGTKRLDASQEKFIKYVGKHWLTPQQPKLAQVVSQAMSLFTLSTETLARGKTFPSMTTIRNRLKGKSSTAVTIGRKGARQAPNLAGPGSTDVRALRYGERAEIDQVLMSIFVDKSGKIASRRLDPKRKDEKVEGELRRLWLHAMIDIASRMPLAWIMAETADADHSMALLRMASRDKTREKIRYGCLRDPAPAVGTSITVADNGTATRNDRVRSAMLGAGSTVVDGRTYHATDKPYVEAFFGTFNRAVLNFETGYTGNRPGELPGHDPKGSATLTPGALYGILTRYFVDEYAHTPHRGTGMYDATPWEKMEECIEVYGEVKAPSPRTRRLQYGIRKQSGVTQEGVKIFNIPYNSTELQNFKVHNEKTPVTVHLDPDHLQEVVITVEGTSEEFRAYLSMTALADLTLEEALGLMTETVRRNAKTRALSNDLVIEARRRRATASGFFSDPNLPASYEQLEALERKAKALNRVEFRGAPIVVGSKAPGSLMDRGASPGIRQVAGAAAAPSMGGASSITDTGPSSTPTFTRITESKL